MLGNERHGLAAVGRLKDGGVALQLRQDAAQCLAYQHVIIDHEDFHK